MTIVTDQLSWEQFKQNSYKEKKPIKKISKFNRLIANSKNFFLISGYGAFTTGYILIISKEFIPSFGLIEKSKEDEINFLINLVKIFIKNRYRRKTVFFEHGMCACIGGLDRAHLHLMSIPEKINHSNIVNAINKVLYNRKAGIKYIEYNKYKLENIHDINHIFESLKKGKKNKDFKVFGKILKINDIKNLDVNKWPLITLDHIKKGGHYVYFNSGNTNSSFLTTYNFQTQFGREVVFEIERKFNKKFNIETNKIKKINPNTEIWRWQNYMYEKNILSTLNDAKIEFKKLKKNFLTEFKKYEIDIN